MTPEKAIEILEEMKRDENRRKTPNLRTALEVMERVDALLMAVDALRGQADGKDT